jgi:hypothetical protein
LQVDVSGQIGRQGADAAVNLRAEVIEDGNGAPFAQESAHQVRADKSCTASD